MRALVLSGGGAAGSVQIGMLKYLIEDLGLSWDCVCGVSVGAINAAYLAMSPQSDIKTGFNTLYNLWWNIQDSTVKKAWFPFRELTGLWKDSIYNSQPLIDLIHSAIDINKIRASGVKVAVSAVELATGNFHTFTQDDGYFADGVLASSAFPMGLCPIVINGTKYVDGGVKHAAPIAEAIALGATDLDIILCDPAQTTTPFTDTDTVTLGMRCFDYMTNQMLQSDLKNAYLYNRLVDAGLAPDKKHLNIKVLRPAADLGLSSLTFDNGPIQQVMLQGYEYAKQNWGNQ